MMADVWKNKVHFSRVPSSSTVLSTINWNGLMSEKNLWQTFGAVAKDKSFPYFSGLRFSTFLYPKNVSLLLSLHNTCNTGRKCTGKKLMENMMTTAINILATFRLVFNWLSRLRLAEFIDATPLLESSVFRLTNRMVVLQVLKKTDMYKALFTIHNCLSSLCLTQVWK